MELFGVTLKRKAVVWLSALIVFVNGFFPAVWILLTSFKTETELIRSPITYLPDAPTLDNYVTAFTAQPILRFMFNSFVVASLSTACIGEGRKSSPANSTAPAGSRKSYARHVRPPRVRPVSHVRSTCPDSRRTWRRGSNEARGNAACVGAVAPVGSEAMVAPVTAGVA